MSKLNGSGREIQLFASNRDLISYLSSNRSTSVVVIHAATLGDAYSSILKRLRFKFPNINTIVASDCFDFWNDFKCWLADDCRVITPELKELRESILKIMRKRKKVHVLNQEPGALS